MCKWFLISAEASKKDQDLFMAPPSVFSSDSASSILTSVIVRAPSGGTSSTSVSF